MRLTKAFFQPNTLQIAQNLLGCYLCRKIGKNILKGKIIETEAYIGQNDKACHASRGMTKRNQVMFEPAGRAYVYIIYGLYYCLNIVTEKKGFPAAVLIRAVEPVQGIEIMQKNRRRNIKKEGETALSHLRTNGPGKLCQALAIDKKLNGENLLTSHRLWLEKGEKIDTKKIITTPRIGVDYAGEDAKLPWRFLIE